MENFARLSRGLLYQELPLALGIHLLVIRFPSASGTEFCCEWNSEAFLKMSLGKTLGGAKHGRI